MIVNINVNVHCPKLSWLPLLDSNYRIYVDEELLAERTWIWNYNTYIAETMYVDIPNNIPHKIHVRSDNAFDIAYTLSDLKINDRLVPVEQSNELVFNV